MNLSIVFDKSDLYRSKRGSITAPIYFDWGDFQFPEPGWSDFVVVVLCWWIQSISKISKGWESEVEFQFMDGPMLIRIYKNEDSQDLEIECVDQRKSQEVIERVAKVPLKYLMNQILITAKEVIKACDDFGWENDDTRLLKRELNSL